MSLASSVAVGGANNSSSTIKPKADGNENEMTMLVDNASIMKMKELEHLRAKSDQRRRRRRPPPLVSSSSSLSSISSIESHESSDSQLQSEGNTISTTCPRVLIGQNLQRFRCCSKNVPLTTTLPLLVFVDMFAVALVVPLLVRFFQSAGVTSAGQRELITSIFSSAQIVGGLVLGALIDAHWIRRKTVLFMSFGGSAVSYALIAYGGLSALVFSRVLVGIVKQTMTITKTLLTRCTSEETRAKHMGRLSASATASWVIGPSVGAVLFKHVDPKAPPMLASFLFLVNMVLAALLLPDDEEIEPGQEGIKSSKRKTVTNDSSGVSCPSLRNYQGMVSRASAKCENCTISFFSNLKSCFSSPALGSVVCASLVVTWVTRATNSNNLSSFYEELYGLEPHQRGYISSYIQVLGFFIESFFIAPVLRWSGGERKATCGASLLLSVALLMQTWDRSNMGLFLGLVCPVTSLTYSIMFTSLQSLVTTVAPVESMFSVLAAMDVLQNAVSVTVPFYRTMLFSQLSEPISKSSGEGGSTEFMKGDPDPLSWLAACTMHWFLATAALSVFLLYGSQKYFQQHKDAQAEQQQQQQQTSHESKQE